MWDNFKPLQDEWIMKGHTHRNEPRIYALCYYLYGTILNHFKMSRGILTEMNARLCSVLLLMWDNFKPLQDEWATKGHTHRNESRIYGLHMGQFF